MNPKRLVSIFTLLAWVGLGSLGRGEVSLGLNVSSGGAGSFYLEVGNYYHVPEATVMLARERHIPDEEIPVALFLAAQAHVGPELIIEQRLAGNTWMNV